MIAWPGSACTATPWPGGRRLPGGVRIDDSEIYSRRLAPLHDRWHAGSVLSLLISPIISCQSRINQVIYSVLLKAVEIRRVLAKMD